MFRSIVSALIITRISQSHMFCFFSFSLRITYYRSPFRFNPFFVQLRNVNLSEDTQATESLRQISPLITPESCSRCHVGGGCWQKPGMPTSPNICPNSTSPCESGGPFVECVCVCEVSRVCVVSEREQRALAFHSYADSRAHLFALSAA